MLFDAGDFTQYFLGWNRDVFGPQFDVGFHERDHHVDALAIVQQLHLDAV